MRQSSGSGSKSASRQPRVGMVNQLLHQCSEFIGGEASGNGGYKAGVEDHVGGDAADRGRGNLPLLAC